MKKCPRCGAIFRNSYNICSTCKLPLERIEESFTDPVTPEAPSQEPQESKIEASTKSPVKKIIARETLVLSGFVAAFIIGILLTATGRKSYVASGMGALAIFSSMGGYILYLVLNLFVWAIRTVNPVPNSLSDK